MKLPPNNPLEVWMESKRASEEGSTTETRSACEALAERMVSWWVTVPVRPGALRAMAAFEVVEEKSKAVFPAKGAE